MLSVLICAALSFDRTLLALIHALVLDTMLSISMFSCNSELFGLVFDIALSGFAFDTMLSTLIDSAFVD